MQNHEVDSLATLAAQFDEVIGRIAEMEMPSLRIVHAIDPAELTFEYHGELDNTIRWRRTDRGPVHRNFSEAGKAWVEMLEAAIAPGFLMRLSGRLSPHNTPPATLSAMYPTTLTSVMAMWPLGLRSPNLALLLDLKCTIRDELGKPSLSTDVRVGGTSENADQRLCVASWTDDLHRRWAQFGEVAGLWLLDSGVQQLAVTMPVINPDKPEGPAARKLLLLT